MIHFHVVQDHARQGLIELFMELVENPDLVFEVPVDRATRNIGQSTYFLQRCFSHTLFGEQLDAGIEDGSSGFFGVFFGSSHGESLRSGWCGELTHTFVYVYSASSLP